MEYEQINSELEKVIKQYVGTFVGIDELNPGKMAEGCLRFIRNQQADIITMKAENQRLQGELAAYRQAEADGALMRLPSRSDEVISIIERAMHFKLYDWQKAFITGVSDYVMPGRTSGKTMARIIRQCLSDGEPIHLYPGHRDFVECTDEDHGSHYRDWYRHQVIDIYRELERYGGLKLRTIYFTEESARSALGKKTEDKA